jgi:lipopolysaccharide/colanic/teichoic acid biosynthesis glycosyltransferase
MLSHLSVYAMACLISARFMSALNIRDYCTVPTLLVTLGFFFLADHFLMWRDLYSKNYHYYLKKTYIFVLKNILTATLLMFGFTFLLLNLKRSECFPGLFIYVLTGATAFLLMHFVEYVWLKKMSELGYFYKNVLIMGEPDERLPVEEFFQDISSSKTCIGNIHSRDGSWVWQGQDSHMNMERGNIQAVKNLILDKHVGEIILFLGERLPKELLIDITAFCRELAISYCIVPEMKQLPARTPWDRLFPYIPILERYAPSRDSLVCISLKRIMDITVSILVLVAFLPLAALIALAIKLEDGGPVLYRSSRIGKNGRTIRNFLKFRTMVVNAEALKDKLLQFNDRSDGPLFKMANDPRITRIGRFLRRFHLDEIPQLVNVLQGRLSLVGPRPHLPEEVAHYTHSDHLRLECIPGAVCLPQTYGSDTMGFREWVDMDLYYRRNWNLGLDLRIIFQAVKVILSPLFRPAATVY